MDSGGMGGWDFGYGGGRGGAGMDACGVDIFCIQKGGNGPFGSPVAQIACKDGYCMTGSWVFSQYQTGGAYQVDWQAQRQAEIRGAVNAFLGQEAAMAAALGITVDQLRQMTYSEQTLKLAGGNWNFSTAALASLGITMPGCDNDRCGSMPSLDFSHPGWVHLDTANPFWGYGFGLTVHSAVDVFLGNTFFAGGIPR
jgi:hypothetical protein